MATPLPDCYCLSIRCPSKYSILLRAGGGKVFLPRSLRSPNGVRLLPRVSHNSVISIIVTSITFHYPHQKYILPFKTSLCPHHPIWSRVSLSFWFNAFLPVLWASAYSCQSNLLHVTQFDHISHIKNHQCLLPRVASFS